ncbi:alpha/beta fold hydrolase [Halalkalibacter okhensis]|uniref:Alpha/beta hydrolase n=1 Tax=Halalkalibacter okhensis TaxID=333138 RepID=A0A0B0IPS4_9BACI|nr:alpha/beta hydrolase [Halalkalibacter okhensis]KHF41681.1 alpha/beta hydrolase [Halalkalibacter okhensis]
MTKEMYVQVDDCKLFAKIIGESYTKPTIVMEAGYGDDSKTWDSVIDELSMLSKVLVYDRAGVGKSEANSKPRTSFQMVRELNELIKKAKIKPPYILVGHSFGGVNARIYATEYPLEVCGLLLIDSTPEEYRERFLPTMTKAFQKAYNNQFVHECNYDEFNESLHYVKATKRKLDVPLMVLSAGKKAHYSYKSQKLWNDMQRECVDLSSNGEFMIVENSAHYIHHEEPQVVINALKKLMDHW